MHSTSQALPRQTLTTTTTTSRRDTTHAAHTSLRSIRTPKHTAGAALSHHWSRASRTSADSASHSLGSPTYCAGLPNRLGAYRIRLSPPRLSCSSPHFTGTTPFAAPHRTEPSQGGRGGPPAPPLPCRRRRRRRPRHTPSIHHSRTGQAAPVQLEQASIHASHHIHRHPSSPPCLRTYL